MTVIHGRQLTSYALAPDGASFAINVTDDGGSPVSLVLPSHCLHELLMTLPEMVRRSLQARFHDQSMRVVYPVGSWDLERSMVAGHVVITLRTPDGFAVSFSLAALELLRMWTQSASTNSEAGGIIAN